MIEQISKEELEFIESVQKRKRRAVFIGIGVGIVAAFVMCFILVGISNLTSSISP